ncbi:isoprenoid synthase domain-containing protein [Mycena rosella]|uniref:Isoprenoid synthase domain-containing protein n=1 Tax=Mycena rosella TaxID=1033263 RepID=A0AAD7GSN4_MYCRO|nr:isoprenoid synthase domain-containing protein [Mycena rosella]
MARGDVQLTENIQLLLDTISYASPRKMMSAGSTADALISAMNAEIKSWALDDQQSIVEFESISKKAISIVEFFYYNHPFEVKLTFAYYAWFFFYIDDVATQSSIEKFQHTVLVGGTHPPGPLKHFQSVLGALYTYWDPICANIMVSAAMDFVTATALEGRQDVVCMDVRPAALGWPKYLRAKSGMAPGYSCAAFPRAAHPDITTYLQALPEIDECLSLLNDILSFYKEDLAGETMNYVSVRAKVSGKQPTGVLLEMVEEVGDLHRRVAEILEGNPDAVAAWAALEHGVIAWHFSLSRYKLSDLGFTW